MVDLVFALPIEQHDNLEIMPDYTGSYGLAFENMKYDNKQEGLCMFQCDNNGLNMITYSKDMESHQEKSYPNVSLQKIEIDNDKHVIAMKLKAADKDCSAIERSATRCGFKVK